MEMGEVRTGDKVKLCTRTGEIVIGDRRNPIRNGQCCDRTQAKLGPEMVEIALPDLGLACVVKS